LFLWGGLEENHSIVTKNTSQDLQGLSALLSVLYSLSTHHHHRDWKQDPVAFNRLANVVEKKVSTNSQEGRISVDRLHHRLPHLDWGRSEKKRMSEVVLKVKCLCVGAFGQSASTQGLRWGEYLTRTQYELQEVNTVTFAFQSQPLCQFARRE